MDGEVLQPERDPRQVLPRPSEPLGHRRSPAGRGDPDVDDELVDRGDDFAHVRAQRVVGDQRCEREAEAHRVGLVGRAVAHVEVGDADATGRHIAVVVPAELVPRLVHPHDHAVEIQLGDLCLRRAVERRRSGPVPEGSHAVRGQREHGDVGQHADEEALRLVERSRAMEADAQCADHDTPGDQRHGGPCLRFRGHTGQTGEPCQPLCPGRDPDGHPFTGRHDQRQLAIRSEPADAVEHVRRVNRGSEGNQLGIGAHQGDDAAVRAELGQLLVDDDVEQLLRRELGRQRARDEAHPSQRVDVGARHPLHPCPLTCPRSSPRSLRRRAHPTRTSPTALPLRSTEATRATWRAKWCTAPLRGPAHGLDTAPLRAPHRPNQCRARCPRRSLDTTSGSGPPHCTGTGHDRSRPPAELARDRGRPGVEVGARERSAGQSDQRLPKEPPTIQSG